MNLLLVHHYFVPIADPAYPRLWKILRFILPSVCLLKGFEFCVVTHVPLRCYFLFQVLILHPLRYWGRNLTHRLRRLVNITPDLDIVLFGVLLHPGMVKNLVHCEPLDWVVPQYPADQILGVQWAVLSKEYWRTWLNFLAELLIIAPSIRCISMNQLK